MLPVSAWPPGPPGASLSPFGTPREIWVNNHPHGFVIPKGAWVVRTTSNQVVMFSPREDPWDGVQGTPGTGLLPGQPPPPGHPPSLSLSGPAVYRVNAQVWRGGRPVSSAQPVTPPATTSKPSAKTTAVAATPSSTSWCAPTSCQPPPKRFQKHDVVLEEWRAWQRAIGRTPPPIRPTPGRRPPNWFGWRFVGAPSTILIPWSSGGLVVADGQNVVITGIGCATITEAYSV